MSTPVMAGVLLFRATTTSRTLLQALPTLAQVQDFAKHWRKMGGGHKMQRVSNLLEWAQTHTLKAQLQHTLPGARSKHKFDSILDLGEEYTFNPGQLANSFDLMSGANLESSSEPDDDLPWSMQMTVLPEGVLENGVVLSSFELLNTSFRSAILLSQKGGRDSLGRVVVPVMAEIDGVHKLHHGRWVLIPMGSHTLRYDEHRKQMVQSFRPWAFLFCPTETGDHVAQALFALEATAEMLWGVKFTIHTCCIDHSEALKNGILQAQPRCTMVTCWPHLSRKLREHRGLIHGHKGEVQVQSFLDYTLDSMRAIHLSKTKEEANFLALEMLMEMHAMDEEPYADWLLNEYLSEEWLIWFVTASGYPSALPSNQPIEANNNQIKGHKVAVLRASTQYCLNKGLPRMIFLDGLDMCGNIQVCLDLIPAATLEGAEALLKGPPNGEPVYTLPWEEAILWVDPNPDWPEDPDDMKSLPLGYLLQHSVSTFFVNNSENNSEVITWTRVHDFLDLLDGWNHCQGNKPPPKFKKYKMMDYVKKVDTLHMICVLCEDSELTKANFQHMIRCDCKP